jgi:alpha-N-acetylglucosaminidase
VWYNTTELAVAWDELLSASSQFHSAANYRHDLVDVTRQALQVLGGDLYNIVVSAFRQNNITSFQYVHTIETQKVIPNQKTQLMSVV